MTHAERCEAVRHCRWADEVVPDAPWVVDQKFMDKYQIDYLAHDELVYPSKDCEDVYAFAKEQGGFGFAFAFVMGVEGSERLWVWGLFFVLGVGLRGESWRWMEGLRLGIGDLMRCC